RLIRSASDERHCDIPCLASRRQRLAGCDRVCIPRIDTAAKNKTVRLKLKLRRIATLVILSLQPDRCGHCKNCKRCCHYHSISFHGPSLREAMKVTRVPADCVNAGKKFCQRIMNCKRKGVFKEVQAKTALLLDSV